MNNALINNHQILNLNNFNCFQHGGVVMLYHPCANQLEVQKLKELVKGCLRRHIITPYNLLNEDRVSKTFNTIKI